MSQSSLNPIAVRSTASGYTTSTAELGELADQIKEKVRLAESHLRDSACHALIAGEYLTRAKGLVKHGEWTAWFESNQFEFAERTAQRYMRFYRKWNASSLGGGGNPTALSDLTVCEVLKIHTKQIAPSTPNKRTPSGESYHDQEPDAAREQQQFVVNSAPSVTEDMGVHSLGPPAKDEWLTPANIVAAVELVLGNINLDPAADTLKQIPAELHYTRFDNGLNPRLAWQGRVFLNPPLDRRLIKRFANRLLNEQECGRVEEAVLLVPARTSEVWFRAYAAHMRVFIGNPQFGSISGVTEPLVAIYTGNRLNRFFEVFRELGDCYVPYCAAPHGQRRNPKVTSHR